MKPALIDPQELRQAMRLWATGVTIVASRHGAVQHGMTVSSFTSVSVTPPVVMVSLSREARSHHLIERARIFGVSILSESQKAAAQCFSGLECEDDRRFEGVAMHTLVTGAPLISGGLAYLDCTLVDTYAVGTNTLFFGEVVATQIGAAGQPLLYFDRDYRAIQGKVQP